MLDDPIKDIPPIAGWASQTDDNKKILQKRKIAELKVGMKHAKSEFDKLRLADQILNLANEILDQEE
jgi:hypothetical protein